MDPSAAPRLSHHLAGLPPSTTPSPLGERTRHSKQTSHQFDSHRDLTMSRHEPEVPEIPPSSPLATEFDP